MSKKILKNLKEGIQKDVSKIVDMDITDQEKSKAIKSIQIEYDIYGKQQKNELEMKLMKDRYKLEKSRQEEDLRIQGEKLEIERERLRIEQIRLNNELSEIDINNKKNKVDKIINISLKVLEIGLPLAVNAALVMFNFKLIYADDGRVPSEMKDLMKNVYRGR